MGSIESANDFIGKSLIRIKFFLAIFAGGMLTSRRREVPKDPISIKGRGPDWFPACHVCLGAFLRELADIPMLVASQHACQLIAHKIARSMRRSSVAKRVRLTCLISTQ